MAFASGGSTLRFLGLTVVLSLAGCARSGIYFRDGGAPDGGVTPDGSTECAVRGEFAPCTLPVGSGTCCSGACVDVAHDAENCGYCGWACLVGSTCAYGGCTASDGGTCPPGTAWSDGYLHCLPVICPDDATGALCTTGDGGYGFCCGGVCGDDCATCGLTCGVGASCGLDYGCGPGVSCGLGAVCQGSCPPGTLATLSAPGIGSICTPTDCAAMAEAEGLPCALDAGAFVGYGICCGGACVDETQDPSNCVVCGNACPAGSFCDFNDARGCPATNCIGAPAETPCVLDAGVTGQCCGDQCVDEKTTLAACGRCGITCIAGATCDYWNCRGPDGGFEGCAADPSACPLGSSCVDNDCLSVSCGVDGQECAFGNFRGECCGGRCTDPLHDPENCGGCGIGSPDGICLEGDAFPIPYDAGTGNEPCIGAFGWSHLGPYCDDPGCACIQGVPPGLPCVTIPLCPLGDGGPALCCDVGPNGGTCIDVLSDPMNCGDCGVVCPSGQACSNGLCSGTTTACGPGHTGDFCNLDAGLGYLCCPGGGCTNTLTDPANCGGCGNVCDAGCSVGTCT